MSRFLAPFVIVIALLAASPATAGVSPKHYGGQAKQGTATASRSTKGACSVTPVQPELVLRCGGKGTAQAKFVFTLPKNAGSVTAQVNFEGTHRGAKIATKRLSDTEFRVTVTQSDTGRAVIKSVMIEYYYC
jgi:hypothetical protein